VIIFVLGGARSGKSEFAEAWAARLAAPVTYVATGWGTDDAMSARIERHRQRRPADWSTVEAAGDALVPALERLRGTVLLDALGTWLAAHHRFEADGAGLCRALRGRHGDTIVVSDEVGLSVHPETSVGVSFRDALGSLNRLVAASADRSVLVVAGRAVPLSAWTDVLP
jgi:adenosyl cobinamide kinase/adenosyl cobinamide phosphate guanylyltransferase